MPIILNEDLPCCHTLMREGVNVRLEQDTKHGPLRIGVLNLMPNKAITEGHIARVLSEGESEVLPVWLKLDGHAPTNASQAHMDAHYISWREAGHLDGIIITGAPVEHLPFSQVSYWDELVEAFDALVNDATPALLICWAAQALLHHRHGLQKQPYAQKKLGLYAQYIVRDDALLKGILHGFDTPVARNTYVPTAAIEQVKQLAILAASDESGVYLAREKASPHYYVFNHLEYTPDTIVEEYFREVNAGVAQPLPHRYFPHNDSSQMPAHAWKSNALRFHTNWLKLCADASFTTLMTFENERTYHDDSLNHSWLPAHRRTTRAKARA